ncbi:MAG: S8 family serine peptidase [Prevotella sp.]|nr:S8 family serine peptidase [Prevotella sp.]
MKKGLLLISLCLTLTVQATTHAKLSPWLQLTIAEMQSNDTEKARAERQVVTYIPVLVASTDGEATIRRHGGVVIDYLEPAYIVLAPVSHLPAMAAERTIRRIEANEAPKAQLDTTVTITGVSDVWAGQQEGKPSLPQAFTGKGVITALMDQGFDFNHPMLCEADGTSRFTWFWDMSVDNDGDEYGKVYAGAEAVKAKGYTSNVGIPHGNHVAGIIGGSSFGPADNPVRGIAYESEMIGVELSTSFEKSYLEKKLADEPAALGRFVEVKESDALILVALKAIYEQAEAKGKPCVVNLSYGEHCMFLESHALFSEVVSHLVGPEHPGRIFVVAAGNNGARDIYRQKKENEPISLTWKSIGNEVRLLVRMPMAKSDFKFTIGEKEMGSLVEFNPRELMEKVKNWDRKAEPDKLPSITFTIEEGERKDKCTLTYIDQYDTSADSALIYVTVDFHKYGYYLDEYEFTFACDAPVGLQLLMAMQEECFSPMDISTSIGRNPYTVASPGSCEPAISVGAMHYRMMVTNLKGERVTNGLMGSKPGQLATISGCGPTIDGRIKPDVVAPGTSIISAASKESKYDEMTKLYVYEDANKHPLAAFSGTSMAAPHVTGVIGLWLQANPKLTQDDVKEIIRKTSHQPEQQFTEKNNYYGWGQIDAYAGLLEALSLPSSIRTLSTHQPQGVTFRIADSSLYADGAADGTVVIMYDLKGNIVRQATIQSGAVSTNGMQNGVYAVQLGRMGSTLIRL